MSRIYVNANDKIIHYENNLVTLKTADGNEFEGLEPRRLFPVSRSEVYITLLDSEGAEVALIRALTDLG